MSEPTNPTNLGEPSHPESSHHFKQIHFIRYRSEYTRFITIRYDCQWNNRYIIDTIHFSTQHLKIYQEYERIRTSFLTGRTNGRVAVLMFLLNPKLVSMMHFILEGIGLLASSIDISPPYLAKCCSIFSLILNCSCRYSLLSSSSSSTRSSNSSFRFINDRFLQPNMLKSSEHDGRMYSTYFEQPIVF